MPRVFGAAVLCVLLANCGQRGGGCACIPPPPPFLAVVQRGANEVAVYPLSGFDANPPAAVTSAAPNSTIVAAGADAIMGFGSIYVGEHPGTVAVFNVLHLVQGDSLVSVGSITDGINDPSAFGVQQFNGTQSLFIANRGANNVTIYEGNNNASIGFNGAPEATLSGLNAPNGLAFDTKGNLWVSQAADVVEFAVPLTASSVPATTITNGLQSPSAIAFDFTGNMYVADTGKNAIVVYPAGSTTPSVTVTNGLSGPAGLYINGSYLYVSNEAGGNVAEYRLPLNPSSQPIATNAVDMNQPSGITEIQ